MTIIAKPPPMKNPDAMSGRRGSFEGPVSHHTDDAEHSTTAPRPQAARPETVAAICRPNGVELRVRLETTAAGEPVVDLRIFTPLSELARSPSPSRLGVTIKPCELLALMEGLHAARLKLSQQGET